MTGKELQMGVLTCSCRLQCDPFLCWADRPLQGLRSPLLMAEHVQSHRRKVLFIHLNSYRGPQHTACYSKVWVAISFFKNSINRPARQSREKGTSWRYSAYRDSSQVHEGKLWPAAASHTTISQICQNGKGIVIKMWIFNSWYLQFG